MNKAKKIISRVIMLLGGLLILISLVLTVYCSFAELRAKNSVISVKDDIIRKIPNYSDTIVVYNKNKDNDSDEDVPLYELYPDIEMKSQNVYNSTAEVMISYIGILRIPSIGLELPVAEEWSYYNLNYAPCRYNGTAYGKGFVICAHNYASHFGFLSETTPGDEIVFTDFDGNNFIYSIESIDVLEPTKTDEILSDEYDLTLFTCNFTGQSRLAVRCIRADEE